MNWIQWRALQNGATPSTCQPSLSRHILPRTTNTTLDRVDSIHRRVPHHFYSPMFSFSPRAFSVVLIATLTSVPHLLSHHSSAGSVSNAVPPYIPCYVCFAFMRLVTHLLCWLLLSNLPVFDIQG